MQFNFISWVSKRILLTIVAFCVIPVLFTAALVISFFAGMYIGAQKFAAIIEGIWK